MKQKRGHDQNEDINSYAVVKSDFGYIFKHLDTGFAPRIKINL